MKGTVVTDLEADAIVVDATLTSIEDVDLALTAIKASARVLFPDIVFAEDEGFADAVAEHDEPVDLPSLPKRQNGGGVKAASPVITEVVPGSLSEKVLGLARENKSTIEIADALDATTSTVGMLMARLRRGGLLPAVA